MFTHLAITTAVAKQHRRDLIAQADDYRLARAARQGRPPPPCQPSTDHQARGDHGSRGLHGAAVLMLASADPAHVPR
jgi:hypothetical protein